MPLPPSPFVTFIFAGLVAISVGNNKNYGQVDFLSQIHGHEVTITINKKQNDTVIGTVATFKLSHETIRAMSNLWVDIEGANSPHQQTVETFISGNLAYPPSDQRDYRYLLNLEGPLFYNRELQLNNHVFKPKIVFTKGLFYTAALTEQSYVTTCEGFDVIRKFNIPACMGLNLGRLADKIGVNLYTDHPSQSVVIRSGKGGSEVFRFKQEPGVTYEILVENSPMPGMEGMGHFLHFYNGLSLNPGEPKVNLLPLGSEVSYIGGGQFCSPVGGGGSCTNSANGCR